MALAMAPVALVGVVVGAGVVTPSPAHAYVAIPGCATYSVDGSASAHLPNVPPALSIAQTCRVGAAASHRLSIRWATLVKAVARRVVKPTPVAPTPVDPGTGGSSVAAMIEQVFGAYAPAALAVARCESGLNPGAYNPTSIGGSHAEGVFQILYPSTWDSTPEAASSPYNALANIEAAHAIFVRDGYNWHEWSC